MVVIGGCRRVCTCWVRYKVASLVITGKECGRVEGYSGYGVMAYRTEYREEDLLTYKREDWDGHSLERKIICAWK
jgi:hypothetical protein